jgi:transcription elongation factor Elf1
MNFKFICPYCKFVNLVDITLTPYTSREIVTCEMDGAGCDKPFVIEYHVNVVRTSLKIEGFEPFQGVDGK